MIEGGGFHCLGLRGEQDPCKNVKSTFGSAAPWLKKMCRSYAPPPPPHLPPGQVTAGLGGGRGSITPAPVEWLERVG